MESVRVASLNKGPFEKVSIQLIDDTKGELGRGKARNQGIDKSDADWIFFLDADDRMHPDAFKAMMSYHRTRDAIWGNIWELSNGVGVWRYQVPRITSYQELIAFEPYQTLQMGHFVKRDKVVRFDEEMNCGEDWKYYLEMWKTNNCIKIEDCLFLNQKGLHSTGPKSATGQDWNHVVSGLMNKARNDGSSMNLKDGYYFPVSDTHFNQSIDKDYFELDHIKACLDACKSKRTAIDCGAHVGGWSKELARAFDSVISYEASSDNYECLVKNTEGLNVEAHNLGVGEKNGFGSLHPPVNPGNSGAAWVVDGDDFKVVTLDSQNLVDVDFIKIDVEGYEPMVLKGAESLIQRDRPVILIEQKPITARYGIDYLEAGKILESWDYVLVNYDGSDYIYRHKDA